MVGFFYYLMLLAKVAPRRAYNTQKYRKLEEKFREVARKERDGDLEVKGKQSDSALLAAVDHVKGYLHKA